MLRVRFARIKMNYKQNVKVAIRVVTPNVTISVELEQSPMSSSAISLPITNSAVLEAQKSNLSETKRIPERSEAQSFKDGLNPDQPKVQF